MKKLEFELEVGSTELDELRPVLEAAIDDHFVDGFLQHRWQGDELRLSGPGASGSLVHRDGRLQLQAELKAPASWMEGLIRRRIDAALEDVAAYVADKE